jgi:hypothetical protein
VCYANTIYIYKMAASSTSQGDQKSDQLREEEIEDNEDEDEPIVLESGQFSSSASI